MSDTPLLIAGLGNPGAEYARNRHNAGFMAVDVLHQSHNFGPWRARFQGVVSEGSLGGRKTYLLKPGTYMNLSGDSVGAAMRFFKLPLNAVVVIHDEQRRPLHHRRHRARLSPRAHRRRASRRPGPGDGTRAGQFQQGR